jgi:preprotein translocase SecE subunit
VAVDKTSKKPKVPRVRKVETVRERTEKAQNRDGKPHRVRSTARSVTRPIKGIKKALGKEYYSYTGEDRDKKFLHKRRSLVPRYFRDAWRELKLVSWPNRRETWKLTTAVFVFAFVFGVIIAITDYGLDALFRKVLLK